MRERNTTGCKLDQSLLFDVQSEKLLIDKSKQFSGER